MRVAGISGLVLDASVVLSWALQDEQSVRGGAYISLARQSDVVVPALFFTEVANALLVAERGSRITTEELRFFLEDLSLLPIEIRPTGLTPAAAALGLARAYGLTVYDATYLQLALTTGFPLATFDRQLAGAAQAAGVTLA